VFCDRPYIYTVFFPSRPLHSEDGGNMELWNVDILPQHYAASQGRRLRLVRTPTSRAFSCMSSVSSPKRTLCSKL
jgi:hypothetical protein